MLETTQWINNYFNESTDAIMIFKDNELIVSNHMAKELQEELKMNPKYLLEVADSSIKQKFSPTENCFDCIIQNKMKQVSIPITLAKDMPHPLSYFMIYNVIDKDSHVFSLTLKNRGTINRMDQLAQQRKLTQYVNRANENERKRISEDLHDSIAQGVYSAIMGVRRLNNTEMSNDDLNQLTGVIQSQLNDTLTEVKRMALDIRPSVLDSFGLLSALRVLSKRLEENSGVEINVIGSADTSGLSNDIQSVLYRIAQEAINNALKHANADEISILLVSHDHFITLEVIDDGDGFDVPKHQTFNGRSLGLMNMNERVKALNGAFNIKSTVNEGTTVTVKFPIV
ncbi:sensor histidine kinase [Companilactobacillus allii]|uniref:Sensor histidine kinase n=1 Tax=Companilactobacillus allii TaxID=1847728 RepID=A0A1P8Q478_9LACO|nr:sensor histidine kinase [Companilactobacillus allii]APX72652.1 two-component sensor histidine kinase [Companilactobacillus allii]USQ69755.1 sensor histidine kinase [Companilactobacillus allii]